MEGSAGGEEGGQEGNADGLFRCTYSGHCNGSTFRKVFIPTVSVHLHCTPQSQPGTSWTAIAGCTGMVAILQYIMQHVECNQPDDSVII